MDPVTMLRQYDSHLALKTLRELRDRCQALLDREKRTETGQIMLRFANLFTPSHKQLMDHCTRSINHVIDPLCRLLETEAYLRHRSNPCIEPLPLVGTMPKHHPPDTDRQL